MLAVFVVFDISYSWIFSWNGYGRPRNHIL